MMSFHFNQNDSFAPNGKFEIKNDYDFFQYTESGNQNGHTSCLYGAFGTGDIFIYQI